MKYERITDEKFVKAVETCSMACVYGENCIECVYFKVDNCSESVQIKLKKAILRLAELEDERENMQAEIIATEEARLQAVKDTAKEICDLILEHWEQGQLIECDWLRVAISERYGVEVE